MNAFIDFYIGCKDPSERNKSELVQLIPWFRSQGKGVLRDLPDENILEILLNCHLKYCQKDEVIVLQGDIGKDFYIVYSGGVNIYVNDSYEPILEKTNKNELSYFDMENCQIFGKCVSFESTGYSFGEYALHDENNLRKASVIATTNSLLFVIAKDKYNQNVKDFQQKDIDERLQFIKSTPLFSDWNPKMRNMLIMSLKKLTYPYQSNVIVQGEAWKGIIIISKGSGSLIIDPTKHESQFPQLYPLDFDVYDKRYQEFPELKPPPDNLDLTEAESVEILMPKYIRLKRAGKITELEDYFINRKNLVCSVQPGEILGDLEFLFDLSTNLYSIVSNEEIEAYLLDMVNTERILKRFRPSSFQDKLKSVIKSKLDHREKYFRTTPVPLLLFLKYKLYDKRIENLRSLPKLKTEKHLPDEALEWQHLLKRYQENKAALCKPLVRGGIFLKDLMEKNATERQILKLKVKKSSDENIKKVFGGHFMDFPITQERIYTLRNLAPNSLRLLELIYNDIRSPRKTLPVVEEESFHTTIKETNGANPEQLEISMAEEHINPSSPQSNVSSPKYKQKECKEFSFNNKYVQGLQNLEINFLNSLCSEKSCYNIKSDLGEPTQMNKKKIHFLPSLKSQNEISSKIIPAKGAQVFIKRRRCVALNSVYVLKDHVHDHFQIVDKLKWEHVEKQQMFVPEFLKNEYKKTY